MQASVQAWDSDTPSGGTVTLSAARDKDGSIIFTVADTRIGMAPEMIPKALKPFRQIDTPLSRNVEGAGLVLSLVKTLSKIHGGSIVIESALHEGISVQVRFPNERVLACRRKRSA